MSTTNTSHGAIPEQSFNRLVSTLPPLVSNQLDLELLSKTMLDPNTRGPVVGSLIPAGYTYLGQFIDHDLTLDQVTNLANTVPVDINTLPNGGTSWFDLDNVYGQKNEFLNAQGLFDIGKNSNGEDDLVRDANGVAFIPDGRDDENRIISGLQLVFLKLHNRVFADVQKTNPTFSVGQLITQSKQIVQWLYQYVVVTDFLKRMCGKFYSRLFDVNGKPVISPEMQQMYPNIPIEFTGAIYRYGHSLVRDAYYLNPQFDIFPVFSPTLPFPLVSLPDLRGNAPLPPNQSINWNTFFPMPFSKGFQVTEQFDTFVTESLFSLPLTVVTDKPNILPLRNLMRGVIYGLPSGQDLATALRIPPNEILRASAGNLVIQTLNNPLVTPMDINHLTTVFGEQTPLFYYTLMDNHVNGNGMHLGSLPSKVIGEFFLSSLLNNPNSYLNNGFSPVVGQFGCVTSGVYTMTELINYALSLPTFTSDNVIPTPESNYFDQFDNRQGFIASIGHALQPSLAIPGAAVDIVVTAYPDRTIKPFDPTLLLTNCTQAEVNQVATNAVKFRVDATLAVARFIDNRTILGIAQGILAPLQPAAPPAMLFPPASNTPVTPVVPVIPVLNADQRRAKAIFDSADNVGFMLKPQAILAATQAAQECNDALFGVVTPPILLVV